MQDGSATVAGSVQEEFACARCQQRRRPSAQVLQPGEGYSDIAIVTIHNAKVLLTASNGAVISAEFQQLPDVADATGSYDADEKGLTRKFGTGGGTGAKLKVQDMLKLSQCSRCKSVKYCSAACQRTDWQTHKKHCVIAQ